MQAQRHINDAIWCLCVTNTDGPTISLLHLQRSRRQIQEPLACKNECVRAIPRFTVDGRCAVDLHRALTDPERP